MPPTSPSDRTLSVAREVAEELARDGAEAVVLVGSHARGKAGPESDVDLLAIGHESYLPRLDLREGMLLSVSMRPLAGYRDAFSDPGSVCAAVPGWREAVVLQDHKGLAAELVREAGEWSWGALETHCDGWVAEEVASLAEEVHKLVAALRRVNRSAAAVQRSLLAIQLSPVLAVHYRILYGSENRLWDLVSDAVGEEWRLTQSAALGMSDEPFEETCEAALRLYGLAADAAADTFDELQRRVVDHARSLRPEL